MNNTEQAINPLTPPACDLRDFPFMPLDVVRLRDSDLAALESPEACWAAVLLWCASWHQIPAASIPDDDRVLSNLAGFGRVVKEWMKVRDGALRGWVKCSDGRLYHPVIAEKALTAWRSKLEQSWKTECARIKKHNQRHPDNPLKELSLDEYVSQRTGAFCPEDKTTVSQGQQEPVPDLSLGKPLPIERERDTDIETTTRDRGSESTIPDSPSQFSPTPSGLACKAIRDEGVPDGNPMHPTFIALIAAGATEDEFREAAKTAIRANKPKFNYVLGIVKGQREDAARLNLGKPSTSTGGKFDPVAFVNQQNSGDREHGRVIEHEN